jgi:hypothetical protein
LNESRTYFPPDIRKSARQNLHTARKRRRFSQRLDSLAVNFRGDLLENEKGFFEKCMDGVRAYGTKYQDYPGNDYGPEILTLFGGKHPF